MSAQLNNACHSFASAFFMKCWNKINIFVCKQSQTYQTNNKNDTLNSIAFFFLFNNKIFFRDLPGLLKDKYFIINRSKSGNKMNNAL